MTRGKLPYGEFLRHPLRRATMHPFSDHFAFAAAGYASYRPRYPGALFEWLAGLAPSRRRAWDCGTGSGQAAVALAEQFEEVVATDPSVAQLSSAERAERVRYVAMTAERAALAEQSVSLVTVAQALHWFDLPTFFDEARRVLVPEGLLAAWSYGLAHVTPEVDDIVMRFHGVTLGPYWPAERRMVDEGYRSIELPFAELTVPPFEMFASWSLPQLAGYLSTWSAVGRFRTARGEDPLPGLVQELTSAWGAPSRERQVRWPLIVRAGRAP
jgi:SAM-dependent methyltransferase